MTENAGACTQCGVNYKRRDFSVDWLGRIVLDGHKCDPKVVKRFQQRIPKAAAARSDQMRQNFGAVVTCIDCGVIFDGWKIQKRCHVCAQKARNRAALKHYHRTKGAA